MNTKHQALQARGFTLVELMISMVIGLVVIGAIYSAYITSGTGQNSNAALSQMSEDATLALNLIRKQVSLAGYSQPYQIGNGGLDRRYSGLGIVGCDASNFNEPKAPTIGELLCTGAVTPNNNAIAVAYEADDENTLLTTGGLPRDCVGVGITQRPAAGAVPAYWLAESRLYIDNNALVCQGNGQGSVPVPGVNLTGSAQPLVNNIVSMRIRYGLAGNQQDTGLNNAVITRPGTTPNRFVTAAGVQSAGLGINWNNVKAIRVCLVVRSEQEILDSVTPYYGCEAQEAMPPTTTTPSDRRLYRAFSTTIMVKNRLGG